MERTHAADRPETGNRQEEMMEPQRFDTQWLFRRVPRTLTVLGLVACGMLLAERAGTALLDICGCINSPKSLGAFDTLTRSGYPPGTADTFRSIVIPIPADGVLVYNSMNFAVRPEEGCCLTVVFTRNQANTPVTILVSGNVTFGQSVTLYVAGDTGSNGSNGGAGIGGLGGPGGFRGGDGAYRQTNAASNGGAGLGPSGGAPGAPGLTSNSGYVGTGGVGLFFGLKELLPLTGGSGGGGGSSFGDQFGCAGGGGGGGGGAILIAANGTIAVNGGIVADGGNRGSSSNDGCSASGGAGSGGAVRLVGSIITGTGSLFARGGFYDCCSRGVPGVIRLEAIANDLPPGNTDPPASRAAAPGPLTNPFSPTVSVTSVAGQPVPTPPQGVLGGIDVFVPVPGPTEIDVATSGVPSGTTLLVNVKPRVGGTPVVLNAPLTNCDTAGNCIVSVFPSLASGAYVIEARATFQTP